MKNGAAAMTDSEIRVRISFHDHSSLGELLFELLGLLRHKGFSADVDIRHLRLLDPRARKAFVGLLASDAKTGEFAARINFISDNDYEAEEPECEVLDAYNKAIRRHKELRALIGKDEDNTRMLLPTHRIVVADNVTQARFDLALLHVPEGEECDFRLVAIAASHLTHIVNHGHSLPLESPGKRLHTSWFGTEAKNEPERQVNSDKVESIPTEFERLAQIELVEPADLERFAQRIELQPPDHKQMLKELHSQFSKPNSTKRFEMPAPTREQLQVLRERFPNFSGAVDVLEVQAALALLRPHGTWRFQPLLLLGEPGIGKTEFARALASLIGTCFHSVSMATATAGWILAGADLSWSSGKPGVVFNLLTQQQFANPVILLDEIDKTGGDRRYDPLGPLYELLEPASACRFKDEAINLPVNASRVHWIATANEPNLDAPLLSRFRVIQIPTPDVHQCRTICQNIYANILRQENLDHHFQPELSDQVLDRFQGIAPRHMKAGLLTALGHAALQGRRAVTADDIALCAPSKRPIGFVEFSA
jgi:ATP-dependent Lon protease